MKSGFLEESELVAAGTPLADQERQVRTVDHAVKVEVSNAILFLALSPVTKQDRKIAPANGTVTREVAFAITNGVAAEIGVATEQVLL